MLTSLDKNVLGILMNMGGWTIKPPKIIKLIHQNQVCNALTFDTKKNVAVVSIFGQTQFANSSTGRQRAFQLAIDAFGSLSLDMEETEATNDSTTISGFLNEDESVIVLTLNGCDDADSCLRAFTESSSTSFLSRWSELKSSYMNALLLLFISSHVLILSNTGSYFDTSYIMLFRVLEIFRQEMHPYIMEALGEIPELSRAWIENGRLCPPRLLFLFPYEGLETSKFPSPQGDPVLKLEKKLETEIYQILRKCRIITNISQQSLFAIPSEQETKFVFMYDEGLTFGNNWNAYIQNYCRESNAQRLASLNLSPKLTEASSTTSKLTHRHFVMKFRLFLLPHLKLALGNGFDDNSSTRERKTFFISPKLGDWIQVYSKLSKLLMVIGNSEEVRHSKELHRLSSNLNIDETYLDAQCSRHFHRVFSVYTKNIPSHYSEEEHKRRVDQTIDAFLKFSRAPGIVPWLEKLAEKCEKFWKRGHQQCATRSLHCHLCTNPLHQIDLENHLEVFPYVPLPDGLPNMKHNTGNRLTSYCNCGRRSGTRDEPFTIREGNYEFYQQLGAGCCDKFESYALPIFQGPLDEKGEGFSISEMLRILLEKKTGKDRVIVQAQVEIEENLSQEAALERDLRQEDELEEGDLSQLVEDENGDNLDDFGPVSQDATEELPVEKEEGKQQVSPIVSPEVSKKFLEVTSEVLSGSYKAISRGSPSNVSAHQPMGGPAGDSCVLGSTTGGGGEYLPGMFHSRCPLRLLPLFPSWSLLKLGSSSLYAHSNGIQHQPGFLSGAAYLLPWDVKVKAEAGVSKPVPRLIRGKIPGRRVKRLEDEFNVKVFLGFDYECKKGHRFMMESPDKVLQMTNPTMAPSIREAATKVATSDMPLYVRCPCSAQMVGDIVFGQLMRVHVVTPKAPVNILLKPRVQPNSGSPYFTPGNSEPLCLGPSLYWILRLPFVYVTEDQIHTPPNGKEDSVGRISKGLFQVVSMSQGETAEWETPILLQ